MNSSCQPDMFEGFITPESEALDKIILLENQQHSLRKGIFKRYAEQESKILEISQLMKKLIDVLEVQ